MQQRPIYVIANEIKRDWKNVSYCARPYLSAMECLHSINDIFGFDSAKEIVLYFLCNASTWKGETAKRVKAELRSMCR